TKGDTLPMGPYLVTYKGKRKEGINFYFDVDYFKAGKNGKPEHEFTLSPIVQQNKIMGDAPEPATRHYLNRDVYTHVTFADMNVDTSARRRSAFGEAKNYVGHVGDTIFATNAFVIIDSLTTNINREQYQKN